MQHDGQMLILARTTDLGRALDLIASHGAASASISIRHVGDEIAFELLCPRHVSRAGGHALGLALAHLPSCREVSIRRVRRAGSGYAADDVANWARSDWQAAA